MEDPDRLELAKRYHRDGELIGAERLYRKVLSERPEDPQTLHLLGVVSHQRGRNEKAVEYLRLAVGANPGFARAHNDLGVVLKAMGALDEAAEAFSRAIDADRDCAEAFFNRATLHAESGQLDEAIDAYRRALDLAPDSADAANNLAAVLRKMGRLQEAAETFERAVEIDPGVALSHLNLGLVRLAAGDNEQGIRSLERAIELDDGLAPAHAKLGKALWDKGEREAGLAALAKATQLDPHLVAAQSSLYRALHETGDPGAPLARYNLGVALLHAGDAAGAAKVFNTNLEIALHNTRELALKSVALGLLGEAEQTTDLLDYARFVRSTVIQPPAGYQSLASFNAALAEAALAAPTLAPGPGVQTRLGRQSEELLAEPKGALLALTGLLEEVQAGYRASLASDPPHPFFDNPAEDIAISAWAVVMEGQGYQIRHFHPDAWISGVYYVRVPPLRAAEDEAQAGALEFGCADSTFSRWQERYPVYRIRPEEGAMVLFPSYFHHHVVPFASAGKRISIAFDVLRQNVARA